MDSKIMEKYINCPLEDILISGYAAKIDSNYFFQPMYWHIYLIINNNIIYMDSNDGDIIINEIEKINCPFEIEEDDIFMLSKKFNRTTDDLGIIKSIEYCYDNSNNLVKIIIKTSTLIIEFDSLDLDGFIITKKREKNNGVRPNVI